MSHTSTKAATAAPPTSRPAVTIARWAAFVSSLCKVFVAVYRATMSQYAQLRAGNSPTGFPPLIVVPSIVTSLAVIPLIVTPGTLIEAFGIGDSVVEVGAFVRGVAVPTEQVEIRGPLLMAPLGSPTQQMTPSTLSSLLLKRSPDGLMMLPGQQ